MAKQKQNQEANLTTEEVLDREQEINEIIEDNQKLSIYYWVRPKVNQDDAIGLSKYGKSKWTDSVDVYQPLWDSKLKKYLTGLDENDPEVLSIKDKKEREAKQAELVALREKLEALTGFNLLPQSDFWKNEMMVFSENSKPLVPYLYANDRIKVEWLKRRGDIPFGSHDLYNSKYTDCKFYIETEDEAINKRKNRKNLQKEAIAASVYLENDYDKLFKVCQILGINKKVNVSGATLIDKLDEWIEKNKKYPDSLQKLVDLYGKKVQELQILSDVEDALYYSLIGFDSSTKTYYRGGVNLGETKNDIVKFFLTPENGTHYIEMKDSISKRKQTARGID